MERQKRERRKISIRAKISGTAALPRLNVFRSKKHIYASLIDDEKGKTLLSGGEKNIKETAGLPKKEKAFMVGKNIGQEAVKKGIKKVVFDRAGYIYHGRVKALAEGAREAGLEF